MNMNKWFVVKNAYGKFCPRISNERVRSYWPLSTTEFDTLEEAIIELKTVKEAFEKLRKEEIVFELD